MLVSTRTLRNDFADLRLRDPASYGGVRHAARWQLRFLPVAFLVGYSPIGRHIVGRIGTTAGDPGEFSRATHIFLAPFASGTHVAGLTLRNIEKLIARCIRHDAR